MMGEIVRNMWRTEWSAWWLYLLSFVRVKNIYDGILARELEMSRREMSRSIDQMRAEY